MDALRYQNRGSNNATKRQFSVTGSIQGGSDCLMNAAADRQYSRDRLHEIIPRLDFHCTESVTLFNNVNILTAWLNAKHIALATCGRPRTPAMRGSER
jgi:hypothetical protein